MTTDTIFDMASLTKCLVTATAIMQLYEAGKITSFDDPVEKYLPAFNATHVPTRARVTLRLLLTHYSGEPADVRPQRPLGPSSSRRYPKAIKPLRAVRRKDEGIHRALTTPLKAAPGTNFAYSDINFILLGALVEKLSGQSEDSMPKNISSNHFRCSAADTILSPAPAALCNQKWRCDRNSACTERGCRLYLPR